jgi:hypothetical protein
LTDPTGHDPRSSSVGDATGDTSRDGAGSRRTSTSSSRGGGGAEEGTGELQPLGGWRPAPTRSGPRAGRSERSNRGVRTDDPGSSAFVFMNFVAENFPKLF